MGFALRADWTGTWASGWIFGLGILATIASVQLASASHILGYRFNETGVNAFPDGSAANVNGSPALNFIGNSGAASDLHGVPGSGVSGSPADRAFDNTTSSGILNASRGQHAADFDAIDGLTAFTLAGWFKLPETATESIGRQGALIENGTISVLDSQGGFRLRGGAVANSGRLELRVNRDFMVESSRAYTEIGQYVNFAVTYNGTKTTNNVQFYKGTTTSPLTLVDTLTLNAGPVKPESIPLTIGVTRTSGLTINPFNGLIDNIRIWDTVVPMAALEGLRRMDSGVPEPTTAVLTLFGLVASLVVRRRKTFFPAGY